MRHSACPCRPRQAVSYFVTVTESQTPSGVVAGRLKEVRRVRGWSVRELANRCAAAGAPELTDNVIENIERGRQAGAARQGRDVTVDQIMILADVLDISPLVLLLPKENVEYYITPQRAEPALRVARWLIGQRPLIKRVPDPSKPGERLPHPGAIADRERRFFSELPSYLQNYSAELPPELQEKVEQKVEQEVTRHLKNWQDRFPVGSKPAPHESGKQTES
jgi:transcriptional regulator with XRE-family HTH domain